MIKCNFYIYSSLIVLLSSILVFGESQSAKQLRSNGKVGSTKMTNTDLESLESAFKDFIKGLSSEAKQKVQEQYRGQLLVCFSQSITEVRKGQWALCGWTAEGSKEELRLSRWIIASPTSRVGSQITAKSGDSGQWTFGDISFLRAKRARELNR